jgi:vitamin-K-epoxide reductase (warfarin-sensitive)
MKCEVKLLRLVSALALVGVLISLYTFLYKQGVVTAEFCEVNGTFDCATVNASSYSMLFGIPVSLIGIFGYAFMGIAAWMKSKSMEDRGLGKFLALAAVGGLAFSLYLTSVEAFVLHAWCMLCLASQAVMLAMALFTAIALRGECPIMKCCKKLCKKNCEVKKK